MRFDLYMAVGRLYRCFLGYGIALKAVTNVFDEYTASIFRAVVKMRQHIHLL